MSVIGSNILAGASGQGGGYNLTNSLRFRSSASAYLNRTPTVAGNRRTFTFSAWVKRGLLSNADQYIFTSSEIQDDKIRFNTDNTLSFQVSLFGLTTTSVFRDPSAWYHVVFTLDTTQATASNRMNIYINGVQQTSFSSDTRSSITQNLQTDFNNTVLHHIAKYYSGAGLHFDGYMAEINMIDGQALTPSSFGETSATTGVWIPKKYTGTYGTNGFYLPFTDNSALTTSSNVGLGKDFSGNANYWTTNNISITSGSTYDSMTDVPTLTSATAANYAVMNPLDTGGTAPTNGNLTLTAGAAERGVRSTFAIPTTGKFYMEAVVGTNQSGATDIVFGLVARTTNLAANPSGIANGWLIYGTADTNINRNGTSTLAGAGTALVVGDIMQIAVDLANNVGWVGVNNTWFNSTTGTNGNPATGANPTFTFSSPPELFVLAHGYLSTINANFGQQPFAYTPPTGFNRLNTFNLPTPTIGATASTQANDYFNVVTYTGNGSVGRAVTGVGFKPDFTWIKGRSDADYNYLVDIIRTYPNRLFSNLTDAASTESNTVTSSDSDGFTVGSDAGVNRNNSTYVAWNWKANGTGVTNTNGSITSTVSANTTAGFSIVTYTGNGTIGSTVGHGLGIAPSMIIVKKRNTATSSQWTVGFSNLGWDKYILLNSTGASATDSNVWNSNPTSSVFYLGNDTWNNGSTNTYVAYCFAQVAGYSAFGSYTGNGSTDGTFVFTGFRPRYLMIKRTDSSNNWVIQDTSRDTYNVSEKDLYADTSGAEATYAAEKTDILSNGFKQRQTGASMNASGGTYIYMAFCESPFKYSNAR